MEIPIAIFLGFFLVFTVFWVIFSGFNIFHAIKFGIKGIANELSLGIYVIVSAILVGIALTIILSTDWEQTIEIVISL